MYDALKEHQKKKKTENRITSTSLLTRNKIKFETRNHGIHLIITTHKRTYDFWPSTGKYHSRDNEIKGRGIFNLIRVIKRENNGKIKPT